MGGVIAMVLVPITFSRLVERIPKRARIDKTAS